MLVKLLKYDIRNILRSVSVFYCIAVVFAVLTRVFFMIEDSLVMNIIAKICSGVTISMMFNIVINNLMGLWRRFRQNFFGDESYVTHTLPVTKSTHYASKFLSALISLFISVAVIGITLFVAYYSKENVDMLKSLLAPVADVYDVSTAGLVTVFLFVLFLEMLNLLQCGYIGTVIGHRMNGGKIGLSVLFSSFVYTASQMVVIVAGLAAGVVDKDIMNLFVTNSAVSIDSIKSIVLISIVAYIVDIIIGYIVSLKLFGKGVNVD